MKMSFRATSCQGASGRATFLFQCLSPWATSQTSQTRSTTVVAAKLLTPGKRCVQPKPFTYGQAV
eukprot:2810317-Rhodomonas_salina.1